LILSSIFCYALVSCISIFFSYLQHIVTLHQADDDNCIVRYWKETSYMRIQRKYSSLSSRVRIPPARQCLSAHDNFEIARVRPFVRNRHRCGTEFVAATYVYCVRRELRGGLLGGSLKRPIRERLCTRRCSINPALSATRNR